MATNSRTINLLEPINQPSDVWTTIYTWVFRVGRYLLVGIEGLLLVVFFARFTLDGINGNLTEKINDKVEVLSNKDFRDQEVKYRNLQVLFSDINLLERRQALNSSDISEVISGVPNKLTLDKFSYNSGRVSLNIKSTDINAVKDYEFSLRQNPKYSGVSITVSKSGSNSTELAVTVSFNISSTDGQGS